jgi:hypothetical protein
VGPSPVRAVGCTEPARTLPATAGSARRDR